MDLKHTAEMKALSREMEPNQSPAWVMGQECQNLGPLPAEFPESKTWAENVLFQKLLILII